MLTPDEIASARETSAKVNAFLGRFISKANYRDAREALLEIVDCAGRSATMVSIKAAGEAVNEAIESGQLVPVGRLN